MLGTFRSTLALLAFGVAFVAAVPARMTNAERFQHGLPPLAPKLPTRRHTARSPGTSLLPPVQYFIKAYTTDDPPVFLGLLSYQSSGAYGPSTDPDEATTFSTQLSDTNPGPGNILLPYPSSSGSYPAFGCTFYMSNAETFQTGTENGCTLASTSIVPAGPPTSDSTSSSGTNPMESQIWTLVDSNTMEITAQWINPGGAAASSTLILNEVAQVFLLVGDPDSISIMGPHKLVRFYLVTPYN